MSNVSKSIVPTEAFIEELLATMPHRYREQFSRAEIQEHARVVLGRGPLPAHAGLCGAARGEPALCVVADDLPGLLAAISASLMLEGFDIDEAEAFTRRSTRGKVEAISLFRVRRRRREEWAPLETADVTAVRETLLEVLGGREALRLQAQALAGTSPGIAETHVRFLDHPAEARLTLELETNDRTGLLLAVSTALFAEGVQIIGSRVRTQGPRAIGRFDLVEADGARIAGTRLQRIQLAVLTAVDGRRHPSTVRPLPPFRSVSGVARVRSLAPRPATHE